MYNPTKSYNRVYYRKVARIRLRVAKVYLRMYSQLTRLWIAGRLVKLAFWVSPDLMKNMGYRG